MPAATQIAQIAHIAAKDIIRRAMKAAGPTWGRLSADGQLVETKAILCDDMLTDRAGAGLNWWIAVQRAVLNIILPD